MPYYWFAFVVAGFGVTSLGEVLAGLDLRAMGGDGKAVDGRREPGPRGPTMETDSLSEADGGRQYCPLH